MPDNIQMMGRGAYVDPQDLDRRQRLVEQLRAQSQHIQAPERSWTQGLARLMQGMNAGIESGQLAGDKQQYRQNRDIEMKKIAGLLSGENPQEVLSQLSLPETQQLGYGMAQNITNKQEDRQLRRDLAQDRMMQQKALIDYKQSLKPRDMQKEYANQAYQMMASGKPLSEVQQMALENNKMSPSIKTLTEEQKARGKAYGKQYEDGQANMNLARDKTTSLDQVLNVMNEAAPGPLFEQRKAVAELAQFVGIDPDKIGAGDPASMGILTQKLNEYVLDVMKSMKGTQTENDREFVINSKPKPTDTPQQIAASIANLKKVNARTIEHGELQNEWVDKFGSLAVKDSSGKSFNEKWSQYINANPLFPPPKTKARG